MPERANAGSPPASGEDAVRQWYDATWPWLYRFVYARVQNREEAEDVTQETVLRVLRGGRAAGRGGSGASGCAAGAGGPSTSDRVACGADGPGSGIKGLEIADAMAEAGRTGFPPPDALVRTIALNLIRDRWRRQRRDGATVPLEEALLQGTAPPREGAPGDAGAAVVVDRVWLEDRLRRLPPAYREVLHWRIVVGLSRAETARQMRRSEAAIRGLQYRALTALRDLLREVDR
ncbi:RNA polymerase, sigma-24 subunit, ECF subfamily [Thermaerobacter marianensis DSM 12885]|uniref:RNA polymerase, sigma-24 subunit, ECF subfamily n=1 Tax=Thermaerobacter marianensis (strain ATCC 700841 / DSM 12885 / JCM 10246 / 7p75a) TaxID=644966 RepID=E6SIU2_THEM7|nr:sigma-70 family RNA polymerase sigma factor [Thermaerobacter marianensis]ADU52036.1 RNA polymerase, sigma-24 subunit, ECF subfamily [Thermaerobacter marianensis DSM 12885]